MRLFFSLFLSLWMGGLALAQTPGTETPAPVVEATPPPPAPIPLTEVVGRIEAVFAHLGDLGTELKQDRVSREINADLPKLTKELSARLAEQTELLGARPSVETLRTLEVGWLKIRATLEGWNTELAAKAVRLDGQRVEMEALTETWKRTLELSRTSAVPKEVVERIETLGELIGEVQKEVWRKQKTVLSLQNKVAGLMTLMESAVTSLREARSAVRDRLLVQDGEPLWRSSAYVRPNTVEAADSAQIQWKSLTAYLQREGGTCVLQAGVLLMLLLVLGWARRRVRPVREREPELRESLLIFEVPVAAAIMLTLLMSGWFYPEAPRLLWAGVAAMALIPTMMILRRMLDPKLYPALNALVVFYFTAQFRQLVASLPVVARLSLLIESVAGILVAVWMLWSTREKTESRGHPFLRGAWRVAVLGLTAGLVANVMGYVSLAGVIENSVLSCAWLAVTLAAVRRMILSLFTFVLVMPPVSYLKVSRVHRGLLVRGMARILIVISTVLWMWLTLVLLDFSEPVKGVLERLLAARLVMGEVRLSVGAVLAFLVTVWAAFLLSRSVRFVLEEDVYDRLKLDRGLPYAISRTLHYVILTAGFFLAIAALGINLTKFTVLAGAFGLGIGFGLQTVVSNFVSGLILLFERPFRVGDVIEMDSMSGTVQAIGIRASIIRTGRGSEVIVPNSKLIAERVTNWNYTDQRRTIDLEVNLALNSNVTQVMEILERVTRSQKRLLEYPLPRITLTKLGPTALTFAIRAWTEQASEWPKITSELAVAVAEELTAEGINFA